MSSGDDWCTIESDPGVFTELLEDIGCTSVQLEELWTLDDDSLEALRTSSGAIYGLIFLFQWTSTSATTGPLSTNNISTSTTVTSPSSSKSSSPLQRRDALTEDQIPSGLFFAHQVTTNACATQAILSVVLNGPPELDLGPTLTEFRDFTASFPPSLKGVAISSSEPIKQAHNRFGRTDAFLNDEKFVSRHHRDPEDVFHFVAYIPGQDGNVYELDGLQSGPIVIGPYCHPASSTTTTTTTPSSSNHTATGTPPTDEDWLTVARNAIQERMVGDAIKFNLMAVLQDKRILLRQRIQEGNDETAQFLLETEEQKRHQWKLENQRRRHNYVPLCITLLKELARTNQLEGLVQQAQEKKQRLQQQQQQQQRATSQPK